MKKEQKLNEFMNNVSNLGLTDEEKTMTAKTKDGVEIPELGFSAVMSTLCGWSPEKLKLFDEDLYGIYKTITAKFIKCCTNDELNAHIHHHVMKKLADLAANELFDK